MSYDSNTLAALASGALIIRDFITIKGRTFEGDATTFNFWTGADNVTTNVISLIDGTVSRSFVGGGTLLDVPPFVDGMGLEARSIAIGFSQIHDDVQDMLRGYDIRVAFVELFRGLIDVTTGNLVSEPFTRFVGRVDAAGVETPEVGATGAITLTCIPDVIDLTRTNPSLSSDETQRLRSDDRFRRYSDTAASVEIWWGQARGAAE